MEKLLEMINLIPSFVSSNLGKNPTSSKEEALLRFAKSAAALKGALTSNNELTEAFNDFESSLRAVQLTSGEILNSDKVGGLINESNLLEAIDKAREELGC